MNPESPKFHTQNRTSSPKYQSDLKPQSLNPKLSDPELEIRNLNSYILNSEPMLEPVNPKF